MGREGKGEEAGRYTVDGRGGETEGDYKECEMSRWSNSKKRGRMGKRKKMREGKRREG